MSLQLKKRKGTLPEDAEEHHSFEKKKKSLTIGSKTFR